MVKQEHITAEDIIIKPVTYDDGADFIRLMNQQYPTKKVIDYFYWMYVDNYLPTKLFTAYHNEKPIGFYGSQIHQLSNGINCSLSIDIILSENFRKLGIFKRFEDEAYKYSIENNCKLMTVFPNYAGMKAHIKLNSWKSIAKIDTLELDSTAEVTNSIVNTLKSDSLIYFQKDNEYLNWRINKNPVYNYSKIKITDKIYSFSKVFEDKVNNLRYGDIVEYQFDNKKEEINNELIINTISFLKKNNCNYISVWSLPHEDLFDYLINIGFIPKQKERYFCVRILDNNYEYLKDINKWHITQIDTEIF